MIRFVKHTLGFLVVALLLSSCASTRKKAEKGSTLSYEQKTRFESAYFEGAKLKTIGDYTGAANKFADALKINPKSHAAMYQMANLNMGVRNFHDAVYWGERSIKLNPNYNFWYYGQLAQAYNKIAAYSKSAETFKDMIRKEPERKSNYTEAANQYINAKDFKSSISVLNTYEKKFGVTEESARKKEGLYFELGKPKDGIEAMKALVATDPTDARFKGLLAESYTRNKQFEEAIATYKQILEREPDNGFAHFGLADVYRKNGEAELSFQNLLKAFDDRNVSIELKIKVIGSFYVFVRKDEKIRDQALQLCEKMVLVHPLEAESYIAYADVLYAIGKIEEARTNILTSTEISPAKISVWQKLLSLDDELDNFIYLEKDSKLAMEYYPNHTFLYIINAFANYTLKNFSAAQKVSNAGLEISIINKDRIDLLTTLADASHELGEHEKSDAAFEELLEIDPDNQGALNNYAYYLSLRKVSLDKALNMINHALTLSPNEAIYLDTQGWVLFQMEKYEEAVKVLKVAHEALPADPEVMEHYANALIKSGHEAEGQKLLEKALSQRKNNTKAG